MRNFLNPGFFRFRLRRFVLLIGDSGAILARISGGSVVSHQLLNGALENNIASVAEMLRQAPAVPLVVLFDVLGQNYRRERIPVVNFFDRAKILSRRLEVSFPGAVFSGGLYLGPVADEARSAEYLLASIAPSPEISAWRKLLDSIENPIDDARLLPIESARLADRLIAHVSHNAGHVSDWHILITQHCTGGFRQIVAHQGRLAMTRMTPGLHDIGQPEEIAELLQREISATIDYITRLGFDRSVGLDAVVIGRADICAAALKAQLPVRRLSAFIPLEAEAIAKLSGTVDQSGHFADLLHIAWSGSALFATMPVLPAEKRKKRRAEVVQSWSTGLAIAASVVGMIYAGALALQLKSSHDVLQAAVVERENIQRDYDAQLRKLDEGPVPVSQMRDMIALHRQLELSQIDFNAAITTLDTALGDGHRLRSIRVQPAEMSEQFAPASGDPETNGAPAAGEAKPKAVKIMLVVDLDGFINVEQAIGEVEQLAERLRLAMPDMQVNIRRQPLNILPGDTLNVSADSKALSFPEGVRSAEIEMAGSLK